MPVFIVRGETPREGALPLRHLSPECPALLHVDDDVIDRVRNTPQLRARTQRCRAGCWAEYEAEYESTHSVPTESPLAPLQPDWPIRRLVSLLDEDINGPEEHPFADVEVQWIDSHRVRITLVGGAPAQIRQAHLTGKPGRDNVVLELESPGESMLGSVVEGNDAVTAAAGADTKDANSHSPAGSIPRGTTVSGKAALAGLLRSWIDNSDEDNVGDVTNYQGNTAWVLIDIDDIRFRMHADTTRSAVERYLALVEQLGENLPWHVMPTARSGAVRKACVEIDRSATPGLFIYSQTTFDEPVTT